MDRVIKSTSLSFATGTRERSAGNEGPGPYRAPAELEEEKRANERRSELAQQRSELNPPEVRIRAWEKVHGLRLPLDSTHPILEVIAVGTRLTLAQVHAEQLARRAGRQNE
jgi:hypothetical protein